MRIILLLFLAGLSLRAFAQVDTVPPKMTVHDFLDFPFLGPCTSTLWLSDLLDNFSDDQTPSNQIAFGIRKSCTGVGFPENQYSITFSAAELGLQLLDLWARDLAGNTSQVLVHLTVSSSMGNCDPQVFVATHMPDQKDIIGTLIDISGTNCRQETFHLSGLTAAFAPGYAGWLQSGGSIPVGYSSSVRPSKVSNPLNGVTTYDLVLIAKHFLGVQPFTNPWQYLAADVNLDEKVDGMDIVEIRKLLLGLTSELPHGQSWRFVPSDYVFPNPANPLSPIPPNRIEVPNTADPTPNDFHFTGVKLGDVNFSADPGQ